MTTTVKVTLDSDGNLTLDRPAVDLNSGDTLEWEFQNVPSDCVPGILFDSPFGPFQALQVLGKNVVQGKGNLGTDGESYTYRAQLLDLNGIRTTSTDPGRVRNLVSDQDTTPMVVMTCQTTIDPQTGAVEVTSNIEGSGTLRLSVGDTALWYVSGLPAGFFLSFRFPSDTNSETDSTIGPFKSFLFNRGVEGESSGVGVIGVSFNPPAGAPAQFSYHIDVRDVSGALVTTHDPVIDNLGQPPTGGA